MPRYQRAAVGATSKPTCLVKGTSMEIGIFWLICAILTGAVASSKGRSGFGWFILGGLFSLLALLAVGLMPPIKQQDALTPTPETHVRCPDCRELVFMDAVKCKHCGAILVPTEPEPSNAEIIGRKLGSKFASKK